VIPTAIPQTTPAPPLALGKRIRAAREACGLSQKELAGLIGLTSATAVSLYEADQRDPSALILWRIAHATRKPIAFFYQP
jgi:transcriptional regulator with XRE-family HTH domain